MIFFINLKEFVFNVGANLRIKCDKANNRHWLGDAKWHIFYYGVNRMYRRKMLKFCEKSREKVARLVEID
ncbi:MAG: hypothetical protein PUD91_08260 [Bacteroidales bacterium]|nr:hypothetical protein [Bacteroidales bacterium]